MESISRRLLALLLGLAAFVAAFLSVMPWGCDDVGGVSSWERCTSALGTPAFSVEDWSLDSNLNLLIPVVSGLLVVAVTWWLTGRRKSDRP